MNKTMNAIGGALLSSVGYTPAVAAAAEAVILVNEYAFIPAMEKIDVTTTRAIWGEEAAQKTEQDWFQIKNEYIKPIFEKIDFLN